MNIKPGCRVLDAFTEGLSRRHRQQQLSLEEGLALKLLGVTRTCNFSLSYPYIIQLKGNENSQTYQVEVVVLIQHQIL